VEKISVNMAIALNPSEPDRQFANLDRPFGLWIGSDDELFLPHKVIAFAATPLSVRNRSQADILPGAKHLSILLRAYGSIGPWIERLLEVGAKT